MRLPPSRFILLAITTALLLGPSAYAVDATKFYFWVAGATEGDYARDKDLSDGYVGERSAEPGAYRGVLSGKNNSGGIPLLEVLRIFKEGI